MKGISVADFRDRAQRRLPAFLFEYIDGGSYLETTMRRNVDDLAGVILRQRVMRDVSKIDTSVRLFGTRYALPVGLGPIGLAGLNARRGECQAVRAANAADVPFCLSTLSACSVSEVHRAATKPFWMQLYMLRDRDFVEQMLDTAWDAGCRDLVFTVDLPVPATRYRDFRTGLSGAQGWAGTLTKYAQALSRPSWSWDVGLMGRPHTLGNISPVLNGASALEDVVAWAGRNFDPSVTWRDLGWIRARWKGSFIIKGILDPDDARAAVDAGADGIVVSNHGGRQLDGAGSVAASLPGIAAAVGHEVLVLADGGVRTGADVVKLIALGARSVLLGRAWAYALAADGYLGVGNMLALFSAEIRVAMSLIGATSIDEVNMSCIESGLQK